MHFFRFYLVSIKLTVNTIRQISNTKTLVSNRSNFSKTYNLQYIPNSSFNGCPRNEIFAIRCLAERFIGIILCLRIFFSMPIANEDGGFSSDFQFNGTTQSVRERNILRYLISPLRKKILSDNGTKLNGAFIVAIIISPYH